MGANAQTTVPKYTALTVLPAASMNISAGTGIPVFATTVTRDAAFGGANKVLAEGQLCYLESTDATQYYSGSAWLAVGASPTTAIFNETQASGTQGGTFTSGSYLKRTLNTTVINNIVGCSIAASVITLPAGTYEVSGSAIGYSVDRHKSRLQNTSDATTLQIGTTELVGGASGTQTRTFIDGGFTLAASKTIELQHRCQDTLATYGWGVSSGFGDSEIYSQITITKVA